MAVTTGTDTHWRDNKSLPECMLYMLEKEIMCDVTFRVGVEKTPVKAHKYMLSSRSPVFHDIFTRSVPEKEDISIPDVNDSNFHAFLRYIYYDEVPNIVCDNVSEMLYLSDKYRIPRIKKECKKFLRNTAATTDAALTLQIAYGYSLDSLRKQSLSNIAKNTIQCLSSVYALDLSKECLELILKSDLKCYQVELFPFFLKWSQNKCKLTNVEANCANMRKMVGHLLYLLADPEKDKATDLLTTDEEHSISEIIFGYRNESSQLFIKERKRVMTREPIDATRYLGEPQFSFLQPNGVEALQFETNKDIWLRGVWIGSFRPYDSSLSCTIRLKVLDAYCKTKNSFHYYLGYSLHNFTKLMFPKPVRISKCTKYTIRLDGLLYESVYLVNCVNTVSVYGVTFNFEKSSLCTGWTDEKQGQFPALIFSI